MEAPKVLYCAFAEVPGPSALGTRMRHWLQALPHDVEVDALTLRGEGLPHIQRVGLARMMRVAAEGDTFSERLETFQRALSRQLAAERYDLVFCADVFSAEVAAAAKEDLKRKTKEKSILVLEAGALPATAFASLYPVDKHDSALRQKWELAENKVFKAVDVVLVPSRYAARVFSARVDARRVQLLPRLVERSIFHPESALQCLPAQSDSAKDDSAQDHRKRVVVFERRASARRTAVLRIVQALNESTTRRQVRLAILGKSIEGDRLQADLDKLFLDRVELLDGNTPQQIAAHLCAADVVVVPSASEEGLDGFSIPHRALEAMACQTPVVVTGNEAPLRSILQNGRCGVVVPEQEPEAAASSVVKLLESPGWRDELVQAAFTKVSQNAARRAIAPKFTKFLGDLLKLRFAPRVLEFDGEPVEDPPLEGTDALAIPPAKAAAPPTISAKEITSPNPKNKEESLLPPPHPILESDVDELKKQSEPESFVLSQNEAFLPAAGSSAAGSSASDSENSDGIESVILAKNSVLSSSPPFPQENPGDPADEKSDDDALIFAANDAVHLPPTARPAVLSPPAIVEDGDDDEGAFADSTFASPSLVDAMSVPSDHVPSAALDEGASLNRASQNRPPPLPAKKAAESAKKSPHKAQSSRIKSDAHPRAPSESVLIDSEMGREQNALVDDDPQNESAFAAHDPAKNAMSVDPQNAGRPPPLPSAKTDPPSTSKAHDSKARTSKTLGDTNRRPPPIRKVAPDADSPAELKSGMPAFSKALRIELQSEGEPGKSEHFASGAALADTQVSPKTPLDADRNLTKEDEQASNAKSIVDAIRNTALGSDSINDLLSAQDSQPRDPWRHDTVADASPLFPDSAPELVELALNLTGDAFRPPPTRPVRIEAETSSSSQPVAKTPSFDHTTEDRALHPSSEG